MFFYENRHQVYRTDGRLESGPQSGSTRDKKRVEAPSNAPRSISALNTTTDYWFGHIWTYSDMHVGITNRQLGASLQELPRERCKPLHNVSIRYATMRAGFAHGGESSYLTRGNQERNQDFISTPKTRSYFANCPNCFMTLYSARSDQLDPKDS